MEASPAKRSPAAAASPPPPPPSDNPRKRRRRSRFASSIPSPAPTGAAPHPPASEPAPNAAVAALRARVAQSTAPVDTAHAAQPAAQKRRRTGRSRFSQAQHPPPPPQLQTQATQAIVSPRPPQLPLDVTAIPVAPVSTLRINRDAQKQRKLASVLKVSSADLLETDPELNPYYDASIANPGKAVRKPKKELSFVTQGEIAAKAEKQREEAQVQARVAQYRTQVIAKENRHLNLPILAPHVDDLSASHQTKDVPLWEWWDIPFVKDPEEAAATIDRLVRVQEESQNTESALMDLDVKIDLKMDRVTHYVHHPLPIESTTPKKPPPALPLMLTKKETKKLRRKRRMEAQKEKQEMVAVGLLPPPKPKVKLSNLMRVLANEASADPTKIEEEVRAQVEERRQKHEMDNQARKKTKEERREKTHEKIEKDREAGLYAAIFRIIDMRNPQHRFKVDINARQWEMTGTFVSFFGCNVVVVEGGLKALRKYKKLMLRRIDWNLKQEPGQDTTEKNEEVHSRAGNEGSPTNSCVLVWEGPIAKNAFKEFIVNNARAQRECRYHFRKHGVEHYWDLCTQGTPLGNENIGVRQIE